MKTRNSLTKAFQQMGVAKAVSRKQNETVAWQERERGYLTELCREKGIEIEVLGVQRDNLSLPEYKAAMHKVEELEQQAVALDSKMKFLNSRMIILNNNHQNFVDKFRRWRHKTMNWFYRHRNSQSRLRKRRQKRKRRRKCLQNMI